MTLSLASPGDCVFSRLTASDGLSDNEVQHILQLADGRMAITTVGNLNIFDGTRFHYVHNIHSAGYPLPGYHGAYHVYLGKDNLVWIKDLHNLRCFDISGNRYVANIDSLLGRLTRCPDKPFDFFPDSDQNIWIIAEKGIFNPSSRQWLKPSGGGEIQDIETLGNLLMVFYSTGESERFEISSGRSLGVQESYADHTAYPATSLVVKGTDGNLYQIRTGATRGSILQRYLVDRQCWEKILESDGVLHTINMGNDGNAYITTDRILMAVDLSTLAISHIDEIKTLTGTIPTSGFNTIYIDRQGGFWIGTYHSGLLYGHPSRKVLRSAESLARLGINESEIVPQPTGGHLQPRENCIIEDRAGNIWTGTTDGLYVRLKSGKTLRLYSDQGLSNNNIKALAEDNDGNVWASSSNGVSVMTLRGEEVGVRAFTQTRGALPGEYLTREAYLTPDGNVLFKNREGWTTADPVAMPTTERLPQPLLLKSPETTPPNSLSLDIASLNYASPEATIFQYSISTDSGSPTWMPLQPDKNSGNTHIKLVNLASGHYLIKVRTSIMRSDLWSEPAEYAFTVPTPWYATGVAKVFYLLAIVAAVTLIFMTRRRAERRKLIRKHEEEKLLLRITELIERCNYFESQTNIFREAAQQKCADPPAKGTEDAVWPDETALSEPDRQFIDRAVELVESNLSTPGYSVARLAADLCMERTGLYKRITTLLDESPSAFMKSIRLNHAAKLLRKGCYSVSEVAEMTGFCSSSYMSKCFCNKWGCTPLEYVAKTEAAETGENE